MSFTTPFIDKHCQHQAGGKEDSAQGVGSNVDKIHDALQKAKDYFSQHTGL